MKTIAFALSLALLFAVQTANAAPAEPEIKTLQQAIKEQAKDMLAKLREKGYSNVGVLKFRARKANPAGDVAGPFGMRLAEQFEVGLVLANPNDLPSQIGITRRASDVAAKHGKLNYRGREGWAPLFADEFPMAWGETTQRVDAFVTGMATVSDDLRTVRLAIFYFDRKSEKLEPLVAPFSATTDPSVIGDVGESFVLRGAFDAGKTVPAVEQVAQAAAKVKAQQASFPLVDKDAPVTLEVLYDGKPTAIKTEGGKARIPDAQPGQKVTLIARRSGKGTERLAVVLKVNGENTLYREKLRDIDCRKWIMEPNMTQIVVGGYQTSDTQRDNFRVASVQESQARELDFGEHVGAISMTVFVEKKPDDLPPKPKSVKEQYEDDDLSAMTRGLPKPAKNLSALKGQLREFKTRSIETKGAFQSADSKGGLVVVGEKAEHRVKTVEFKPDPTPAMSVTITYYTPSK